MLYLGYFLRFFCKLGPGFCCRNCCPCVERCMSRFIYSLLLWLSSKFGFDYKYLTISPSPTVSLFM